MKSLHLILPFAFSVCAAAPSHAADAPYNAATTYAKLVGQYPYIAIASAEAPAPVRVLRGLTYIQRGARPLQLDLYLPGPDAPSTDARPVPLVVLVHGGGWRSGTRENMAPLAVRLAVRGYAAATVSYRLSGEAPYPAAIHDIKQAIRWLRSSAPQHGMDPARIAVAGGSAGGQIAALVGMTNGRPSFDPDATAGAAPSTVQAVINIDGLSDFTSEEARKHEDDPAKNPSAAGAWLGGRYADRAEVWREASPITHAGAGAPPVLFITSSQQRFSVGREQLAARLGQYNIATEHVHLPGTPHSFWLFDPWLAPTADAMAAFLHRTLHHH